MTCLEMVQFLSDYLDGELDTSMRAVIEKHNGECPPCLAFARTLARTVETVQSRPREPLSPELKMALLEALRRVR
jgi:predicted anti-sigma-YlaC factor YlaD